MNFRWKDTLKIYFQNANSIRSTRLEKWLDICVTMKRMNVDLFGFSEININPSHPGLTDEMVQIAQRTWTHSKTCLVNTEMDCRAWAQQGSTSLTTVRCWVSRVLEVGTDKKFGRWSYQILWGRGKHRVVFLSGYRFFQNSVAGPFTEASWQWPVLMKASVFNPNPRKQFFHDLSRKVKK